MKSKYTIEELKKKYKKNPINFDDVLNLMNMAYEEGKKDSVNESKRS